MSERARPKLVVTGGDPAARAELLRWLEGSPAPIDVEVAPAEAPRGPAEGEPRLREAERRKDELLAMLGHELRNPLAAIRHAAELVKHLAAGEPRLVRIHAALDRQTTHMTRLIDGLLEVSRIALGKVQLERRSLDLRAVLEGVIADRRVQLAGRSVTLEHTFPPEPAWISGDEVRLTQIFDNIVGNAVKFTERGTISVTLRVTGEIAEVAVRDTGPGLRREALVTIFEPFRQDTHGLARAAGGLGLGLALVKGLVQLHGGSVEARSDGPGTGAEIVVRLPLAEAPRAGARGAGAAAAGSPAQRILLVEDNADAAQMLQDLLELEGHEVLLAGDGPRALEVLRERGAQIVLCDLGLPGMSGYDLARTVRADPALQGTALVALTGFGQAEDRRRTLEAGFDDHLVKPVSLQALTEVIRRLAR